MQHRKSAPALALLALAAAAAGAGQGGQQHDHHHHEGPPAAAVQETALEPQIPDTVLIDQDGTRRRFYSDLVEGKLVLMNSVYTSCPGTCPMQTAIFQRVQRLLGDRLGAEVQMISVSLDPVTDTPERLKEFAARFGIETGRGWVFLTGPKQDVDEVLQSMDLYAPIPEEHTPIAAIGHEPAGLWMKVINLSAPREIVSRLDYVKELGERKLAAR